VQGETALQPESVVRGEVLGQRPDDLCMPAMSPQQAARADGEFSGRCSASRIHAPAGAAAGSFAAVAEATDMTPVSEAA
jgi:hypothetical protein